MKLRTRGQSSVLENRQFYINRRRLDISAHKATSRAYKDYSRPSCLSELPVGLLVSDYDTIAVDFEMKS